MWYFATASGPLARDATDRGLIGQIITPASGNRLAPGRRWCADNAAFTDGYPGDERYLRWLSANVPMANACAFAVAPDVPLDAAATLALSMPMLAVALCAQDGLQDLTVPWDEFDALFIAGSTEWKLSGHARALTREAKSRSLWVHMGRVNSWRRIQYAAAIACDSVDGTYLAYGPDSQRATPAELAAPPGPTAANR